MLKRKGRKRKDHGLSKPRRPRVVVAMVVAFFMVGISLILAQQRSREIEEGKRSARAKESTLSPASFDAASPSKEYVYAGGRLLATEEPSGGGGSGLTAPTNLMATASSSSQVNLTWTASSGAVDHYEVQRTQNITSPFTTLSPNPTTPGFTDNGVSGGITYIYRVRAVDAVGNTSAFSGVDLATTISFTDDPLIVGTTLVKAQHLTEMRQAVDAVRAAANMGAASWTDTSQPGLLIKAIHIQQLRDNLDPARQAIGVAAQSYSDQPLTAGIIVKKSHVEEIRLGVK